LRDHQRKRSLQNLGGFLHGESTFKVSNRIMALLLWESNRKMVREQKMNGSSRSQE
jgi:hypothetical protein